VIVKHVNGLEVVQLVTSLSCLSRLVDGFANSLQKTPLKVTECVVMGDSVVQERTF
jgi:hypothetical protein